MIPINQENTVKSLLLSASDLKRSTHTAHQTPYTFPKVQAASHCGYILIAAGVRCVVRIYGNLNMAKDKDTLEWKPGPQSSGLQAANIAMTIKTQSRQYSRGSECPHSTQLGPSFEPSGTSLERHKNTCPLLSHSQPCRVWDKLQR